MSLGREVLTIKIQLSEYKSDTISVHERDEPQTLALKFCTKHNLPSPYQKAINYMIDKNLDILIDEELNPHSPKPKHKDMYTKGIEQLQKKLEKVEKMRKELESKDSKELTFKPCLSPKSDSSRAKKLSNILKISNQCIPSLNTEKIERLKNTSKFHLSQTARVHPQQYFQFQPHFS